MKKEWEVYIKGVPYRGDEVIKVLVDLGGKNEDNLFSAENDDYVYYINHKGDIDCEYTDSETAQIIMDKYTELHLPEQWKDGDILVNKNANYKFCVFEDYLSKRGSGKDMFFFYCEVAGHKGERYLKSNNRRYFHDVNDYRMATKSEVAQFHDTLHTYNKEWDAEKKQIVDWKWKPSVGDRCWMVASNGKVKEFIWFNSKTNMKLLDFGNCFHTKEEAKIAAKKIKKLLKGEQQ